MLFQLQWKGKRNNTENSLTFVASTRWLQRFMRRNGLSLKWKISVAHKDPSWFIDQLVSYVLHTWRLAAKYNYSSSNIIAMDEKPVWADMVCGATRDNTGARTVTMKSSGNEKYQVSVCLIAKPDGTDLKPFIVFKDAKHDLISLKDENKTRCGIASLSNG